MMTYVGWDGYEHEDLEWDKMREGSDTIDHSDHLEHVDGDYCHECEVFLPEIAPHQEGR